MGVKIDDIIAGLPVARQEKIAGQSGKLVAEMISHAQSLKPVRSAFGHTQAEVAARLGVGQVAVAQMEQRQDMLVSTLRRYLQALGADLKLVVTTADGGEIVLQGLGDGQ